MLSVVFALALTASQPGDVAAAPARPPQAPKARSASERRLADAKVECRELVPTGSNLPKTFCATT
jgi:hypothetical protein